jgi:hypothetical protein
VGIIKRAALDSQQDYSLRELAEAITSGLPSKDYLGEYLAIYYWVLANTRYQRDPRTVELVRSPDVVARGVWAGQIPGLDCDDMTALICALVLSVGGQCRATTVAFRNMFHKGQRQYSHVFAQAKEPRANEWITLDPVAADKTEQMMNRVKAVKFWPVA